MEKDFDLKKDPAYQTADLRERINQSIKRIYDDTGEVKHPQVKRLSRRKYYKRSKTEWNKNDL